MNLLILSAEDQSKINECIKFADDNPVSFDDMLKISQYKAKPVGDDPRHVVYLMRGYRVVYSLEHHGKQPKKDGVVLFRHISISYCGKLPSVEAAQLILDTYQFDISLRAIMNGKVVDHDTAFYEDNGSISIIQLDKRESEERTHSSSSS